MLNLLTEEQLAKQLSVSIASLRRWRLLNRGPKFIKVGSLVRYRPDDVERWLAELPTGGESLPRLSKAKLARVRSRRISPSMSLFKRGKYWWYEFNFAGRRIQETSKSTSKTIAKQAEQQRRRELEVGFNSLEDARDRNIRTLRDRAAEYLESYALRNRSKTFAEYAIKHLLDHLGGQMLVDLDGTSVRNYQDARLKEKAAPKTINEEVGFLLRLLDERGELIRAQLKRQNVLKLKVRSTIAKVYPQEEKQALMTEAQKSKSPNIYPALMLAQNTGMRSSEIRRLQWTHVDLKKRFLIVGRSKTDAGEGRTIPLNSSLFEALSQHAVWFETRFGKIEPDLYLFPFGKSKNLDPTRPVTTLKTAWRYVKKRANVKGRLHVFRLS